MFLIINSGSSSVKFDLINSKTLENFAQGIVDGIGLKHCLLETKWKNHKKTEKIRIKNHKQAIEIIFSLLSKESIISSLSDIRAVGHRVVHGGEFYTKATIIDRKVIKSIARLSELAPLHNPANLEGIKACLKLLKKTPNIAVFDTAFHQTMPEYAYLYGLPYSLYKKSGIRRYGFHGINHQYVTDLTLKALHQQNHNLKAKIISCHLGNGASIAASLNGKCIDTSMGFTPLEGLLMGTRCGDLDPAIIFHLIKKKHWAPEQIDNILNTKSGLKGISEISSDMRDLYAASKLKSGSTKHQKATRAINLFCYRVTKYIGAYSAALGGIDALVFTGGMGEKAWYLRRDICRNLSHLGIKLDPKKNQTHAPTIHAKISTTKIYVTPANEAMQIAKEIKTILL